MTSLLTTELYGSEKSMVYACQDCNTGLLSKPGFILQSLDYKSVFYFTGGAGRTEKITEILTPADT